MFSRNEARPRYNLRILTETYENEERQIQIYEHFRANPRINTLTGKFYSKYEVEDLSKADPDLMIILQNYFDRGPHERYSEPVLESQVIGWYSTVPFMPLRKDDKRFYHPRTSSVSTYGIIKRGK